MPLQNALKLEMVLLDNQTAEFRLSPIVMCAFWPGDVQQPSLGSFSFHLWWALALAPWFRADFVHVVRLLREAFSLRHKKELCGSSMFSGAIQPEMYSHFVGVS